MTPPDRSSPGSYPSDLSGANSGTRTDPGLGDGPLVMTEPTEAVAVNCPSPGDGYPVTRGRRDRATPFHGGAREGGPSPHDDALDDLVAALGARPKPFVHRTGTGKEDANEETSPAPSRKHEPTVMISPPATRRRLVKWAAAGFVIAAALMGGALVVREHFADRVFAEREQESEPSFAASLPASLSAAPSGKPTPPSGSVAAAPRNESAPPGETTPVTESRPSEPRKEMPVATHTSRTRSAPKSRVTSEKDVSSAKATPSPPAASAPPRPNIVPGLEDLKTTY